MKQRRVRSLAVQEGSVKGVVGDGGGSERDEGLVGVHMDETDGVGGTSGK